MALSARGRMDRPTVEGHREATQLSLVQKGFSSKQHDSSFKEVSRFSKKTEPLKFGIQRVYYFPCCAMGIVCEVCKDGRNNKSIRPVSCPREMYSLLKRLRRMSTDW